MEIQEITFEAKTYLTLKKSIPVSEVSNKEMYDQAGKKLGSYMQEHGIKPTGSWSVLYFTWDTQAGKTDLGIAFPVSEVSEVTDPELSLIEVKESKASKGVLKGSYQGLAGIHQQLMDYSKEKAFGKDVDVMAVEEYLVGPMEEPDESKFITNIYYLHN